MYSIYAGDTAIINELSTIEQESIIFPANAIPGISDRIYLTVGSVDSYLAYEFWRRNTNYATRRNMVNY